MLKPNSIRVAIRLSLLAAPALLTIAGSAFAAQPVPQIFWASEPVRPNETVMVQGSDLGSLEATVEMARLDDGDVAAKKVKLLSETTVETPIGAMPQFRSLKVDSWTRASVLQASDHCLKFVVPQKFQPGVFACRITSHGAISKMFLLNTPDAWWMQGDEGEAASPGGWFRLQGKSLAADDHSADQSARQCQIRLEIADGAPTLIHASSANCYSAKFDLPATLALGSYAVRVHNGHGSELGWRTAGTLKIVAAPIAPTTVYNVLDSYGPDAVRQMRGTLVKYMQPLDRTEGIRAALKKAQEHGGGVVYFPAGRYAVKGQLDIPDHTILRGEGMGVVTLWWGTGSFNLDGGGPQGRARVDGPRPPDILIFGRDYGLEEMSLYLPQKIQQGIVADNRLRMQKVRIRVDHSWLSEGRGEGTVLRMGRNFQVNDCDIFATGAAMRLGQYGVVAHNRILAMKINTELGGSQNVVVEDNQFVSMDPTTYQNIAGRGRNIYYARNRHESLYVHQADYSFTFDASTGAYMGGIAKAEGTRLTLAADPTYPQWATEKSDWWHSACVCILAGRGAGQWRDVVSNKGRAWAVDRPFDVAPDATSVATIVPFNGRVLVVGNRFEDAAWVNAGYGTSIEVIYADNTLVRTGILMNHGVHADDWFEPSWYVQYFDNRVTEGQTNIESLSGGQRSPNYTGPLTRCSVHRRQILTADNSGNIIIHGNIDDALVEDCQLHNSLSAIKVDSEAHGVVFRNNRFVGKPTPRYAGDGLTNAVVVPLSSDQ